MRKSFLFLTVLAGCFVGVPGCVGAIGALLPGLVSDLAFGLLGTVITSLITGALTPATQQ